MTRLRQWDSEELAQLSGGRARIKTKQFGSSLYNCLVLPLDCRQREEMKGRRRWEKKKVGVLYPPGFPSVCLVSQAVSTLGLRHTTGHGVPEVDHWTPGDLPACLLVSTAPSSCLGRAEETPAPSSNKHVEMDGSHISQLQLAARFGEITFPGTNWEPVLEVKGTAH